MAYRKEEVRRESETKIILITTARATQHIKRRAAKRYGPARGRLCGLREGPVRLRARPASARVVAGWRRWKWRRGSLQWAFVGRLAQIQTQRRQFVLRTVSGYTLYMYIYSCTDSPAAAVLYIYSCVCVCSVPRTLHRGSGHRVKFLHFIQDYPSVVVRGDRGKRDWVSRERIDGEKPPGGTPSPQQCVIRRLTPSPIYRGKRMYDLYYIYCTYIYIYMYMCVWCVCIILCTTNVYYYWYMYILILFSTFASTFVRVFLVCTPPFHLQWAQ